MYQSCEVFLAPVGGKKAPPTPSHPEIANGPRGALSLPRRRRVLVRATPVVYVILLGSWSIASSGFQEFAMGGGQAGRSNPWAPLPAKGGRAPLSCGASLRNLPAAPRAARCQSSLQFPAAAGPACRSPKFLPRFCGPPPPSPPHICSLFLSRVVCCVGARVRARRQIGVGLLL